MKKILVTGACGFIGSNLVERLVNDGNIVIGIDKNLVKRNLPKSDTRYYKMSVNKVTKNFSFIWDDINNIKSYHYMLDGVDEVYHLAAYVTIRDEDVHKNINDTVMGTFELLDLIIKKGIKKLIFSSTSSIYGEEANNYIKEDHISLKPISHYASGKIANEAFIQSYAYHNDIKVWIFRFANVTGKNQNRGVIKDLLDKLEKNSNELEVLGNGKQTKSFFDVSDCVEALISIPMIDGNKNVEVYNLGNTELIEIKQLANIVCDESHYNPKIIYYKGGDRGWKGDTPHTIIDIKKSLRTGWSPKYTCEQSIRRTVRDIIDNQQSSS